MLLRVYPSLRCIFLLMICLCYPQAEAATQHQPEQLETRDHELIAALPASLIGIGRSTVMSLGKSALTSQASVLGSRVGLRTGIAALLAKIFPFSFQGDIESPQEDVYAKILNFIVQNHEHSNNPQFRKHLSAVTFQYLIHYLDLKKIIFLKKDIENLSSKFQHVWLNDFITYQDTTFLKTINELRIERLLEILKIHKYLQNAPEQSPTHNTSETLDLSMGFSDFAADENERTKRIMAHHGLDSLITQHLHKQGKYDSISVVDSIATASILSMTETHNLEENFSLSLPLLSLLFYSVSHGLSRFSSTKSQGFFQNLTYPGNRLRIPFFLTQDDPDTGYSIILDVHHGSAKVDSLPKHNTLFNHMIRPGDYILGVGVKENFIRERSPHIYYTLFPTINSFYDLKTLLVLSNMAYLPNLRQIHEALEETLGKTPMVSHFLPRAMHTEKSLLLLRRDNTKDGKIIEIPLPSHTENSHNTDDVSSQEEETISSIPHKQILKISSFTFTDHWTVFLTSLNEHIDDILSHIPTEDKQVKPVILDLRNNTGGDFDTLAGMVAVRLGAASIKNITQPAWSGEFSPFESVTQRFQRIYLEKINISMIHKAFEPMSSGRHQGPIILLTNERTSSASELLAHSLINLNKAIVIAEGGPTIGKDVGTSLVAFDKNGNMKTFVYTSQDDDIATLTPEVQKYKIAGVIPSPEKKSLIADIFLQRPQDAWEANPSSIWPKEKHEFHNSPQNPNTSGESRSPSEKIREKTHHMRSPEILASLQEYAKAWMKDNPDYKELKSWLKANHAYNTPSQEPLSLNPDDYTFYSAENVPTFPKLPQHLDKDYTLELALELATLYPRLLEEAQNP